MQAHRCIHVTYTINVCIHESDQTDIAQRCCCRGMGENLITPVLTIIMFVVLLELKVWVVFYGLREFHHDLAHDTHLKPITDLPKKVVFS